MEGITDPKDQPRRNLGGSQEYDYGSWDKKGPVLRIIGSIKSNSVGNARIA
jgi:hypothetical protein